MIGDREVKGLKNHINENREEIETGLANGDPAVWHKVIMAGLVGAVGLLVILAIVSMMIIKEAQKNARNFPVVVMEANSTLPEGSYYIYKGFRDQNHSMFFLVSSMKGGIVVSVEPPKETQMPEDLFTALYMDPASYTLKVSSSGAWTFDRTMVHEQIRQKYYIGKDKVEAALPKSCGVDFIEGGEGLPPGEAKMDMMGGKVEEEKVLTRPPGESVVPVVPGAVQGAN